MKPLSAGGNQLDFSLFLLIDVVLYFGSRFKFRLGHSQGKEASVHLCFASPLNPQAEAAAAAGIVSVQELHERWPMYLSVGPRPQHVAATLSYLHGKPGLQRYSAFCLYPRNV